MQEQPPTDLHGVPLEATPGFQPTPAPQEATTSEDQQLYTSDQVQSEINRQHHILHQQQQQLFQQQHHQVQQQIHLQHMQQHLNNSIAAGVMPIQIPGDPNVPISMSAVPMTMSVPLNMPINPATFGLSSGPGPPEQQQQHQQQQQTGGSEFGTPQQSTPENTVIPGDSQHSGLQHQGSIEKLSNETYV